MQHREIPRWSAFPRQVRRVITIVVFLPSPLTADTLHSPPLPPTWLKEIQMVNGISLFTTVRWEKQRGSAFPQKVCRVMVAIAVTPPSPLTADTWPSTPMPPIWLSVIQIIIQILLFMTVRQERQHGSAFPQQVCKVMQVSVIPSSPLMADTWPSPPWLPIWLSVIRMVDGISLFTTVRQEKPRESAFPQQVCMVMMVAITPQSPLMVDT